MAITRAFLLVVLTVFMMGSVNAKYPVKPIRLVVTLAPGGTADILARMVSEKLSQSLGQPVIVENRPGASGMIGAETVAKAAPDGYTLLMAYNAEIAINQSLFSTMRYDAIRDLEPITIVGTTPMLLVVNPELGVSNLKDLVALAKANPKALSYASAGVGSTLHLASELLNHMTSTSALHVPFKSASQAVPEVIGNRISMVFSGMPLAMPHVREGRLQAIAISTSSRSPAIPDVPTVAEQGYDGFDITNWFGIFAPAGTPQSIIDRLYKEIRAAVSTDDVKQRLGTEGGSINPLSPPEFQAFIQSEVAKYQSIIASIGLEKN
ncbi:Bug family tripartite tricarboxylate transporter substrate binding protein [Allopusillimonas ginsengisoli]|uniref:Bug family tripartite tricarboxylate transporter substrate binding protein n=1 Tax=Allopusillimonas ginsengisoli TaxID=453575 RepID=UPI0010223008|nr:tripartite tricarboxylate transporter substrate binding protein [Allopusillimonas ginsengisoli]TEA77081.1 tripartite tricarboxylate transporter substrate binding protein [Allopusillimonas ginsengisoli]